MQTYISKQRDYSIDMAKGILIAMLIFHHINDTGRMAGIENDVIECMRLVQPPLIVCYFMPAFFLISGMCSNFNKDFLPFLVNQIKGLIIPAISFILLFHIYQGEPLRTLCGTVLRLFLYGKDYWFLVALFEAKIIYYFLYHNLNSKKILLIILLFLSACGTLLNDVDKIPNFFMHRHALDLMFFVGIGNVLKEKLYTKSTLCYSLLCYIIICSFFILSGMKFPYVTYTYGTSIILWPIHIAVSITGSIVILSICKRINRNSLLEYMGRNSLAIFLMQWYTLIMFMEAFKDTLNNCTMKESVVLISVIFMSTIAIGMFVAYITNTTRLRILMGKF